MRKRRSRRGRERFIMCSIRRSIRSCIQTESNLYENHKDPGDLFIRFGGDEITNAYGRRIQTKGRYTAYDVGDLFRRHQLRSRWRLVRRTGEEPFIRISRTHDGMEG